MGREEATEGEGVIIKKKIGRWKEWDLLQFVWRDG